MENVIACPPESVAPVSAGTQDTERVRVLELLRYFQPSSPGVQDDKARVASDTSLTAYAQLCALKMNCQRSFISLMDDQNQHIIAEATRSVSLKSEDIFDGDGDAIYLGATMLDLVWGVCPNTIKLFTSTDGSLNVTSQFVKATESHYVMNDLSKVPGFENRPYVAGWPFMRYYAEVPIHSPSGFTIGTMCVVDDHPRDGLDKKGLVAMKEIADAVMNHLELVVSKVQRRRAERMIQGLGLFVEGSHNARQRRIPERPAANGQENYNIHRDPEKASGEASKENQQGGKDSSFNLVQNTKGDEIFNNQIWKENQVFQMRVDPKMAQVEHKSRHSTAVDPLDTEPIHSQGDTSEPNAIVNGLTDGRVNESQKSAAEIPDTSANSQKTLLLPDLDKILFRATGLIREAIDLDGIASFDPRLGNNNSYSGTMAELLRADSRESLTHESPVLLPLKHKQASFDGSNAVNELIGPLNLSRDVERFSKVLACSTRANVDAMNISTFPWTFPEPLLHRIIEGFPGGGVLNFDAEGLVSRYELELAWDGKIPQSRDSRSTRSKGVRQDDTAHLDWNVSHDAQELWRMLPTVRSVLLFPLWNLNEDRLIAYSIAWTTNPTRVFHREDFACLASFANLIKAELSRLDVIAADRAKADFISSISHELRSPLHGILATAELLKESMKDPTSNSMIETIEACGSTLLDTMDNLLTFAKINNFTVTQGEEIKTIELPRPGQRLPQTIRNLPAEIDLESLVEEVMNASVAGHQYRNFLERHVSSSASLSASTVNSSLIVDDISIICDIEPRCNWYFNSQAGAWKRILMNLVGNSLKYTTTGFIHVRLWQGKKSVSSHGVSETKVYLSVKDSGQGISEGYLKDHLFKPFRQEDPISPGTGLGLSIVRQLVKSINGSIEVTSNAGSGTTVEVTAVLESPPDVECPDHSTSSSIKTLSQLRGGTLGIMLPERYPDVEDIPSELLSKLAKRTLILSSYLTRSARDAFSMETVKVSSLEPDSVDILMTTESAFQSIASTTAPPRTTPLIVLCDSVTLDYRPVSNKNGPVIYLSQPFGPQKLRRAMEHCLPYCRKSGRPDSAVPNILPFVEDKSISVSTPKSPTIPLRRPLTSKTNTNTGETKRARPRALLVEDNPINLKLLTTFMTRLGCPYTTATDGLEAVELYREAVGRFDIVLTDIQMPRMDGIAASYQIRKFEIQEVLNRTLIIALTGFASTNIQEQAKLNGVDLFLTKPVPLKSLKAIIDEHFLSPTDI